MDANGKSCFDCKYFRDILEENTVFGICTLKHFEPRYDSDTCADFEQTV